MSHCLSNIYKNLSPLSIPFHGNIEYFAKYNKATKKCRKAMNLSFLPDLIRFYRLV